MSILLFGLSHKRHKLAQKRSHVVVVRLMVSKQAGFLPTYRQIIVVLTDIINGSIWVYQCIKSGSELSKLLLVSTENEIL